MEPHKTESTTSLLSTIVDQLSALIRAELHLARSEVDQNLRRVGRRGFAHECRRVAPYASG